MLERRSLSIASKCLLEYVWELFVYSTDCPQRDERLGWTGDIQVFGPSATFLYDRIGRLSEWMEDVACEQSDHNGVPPLEVPNILDHVWPSTPQALWDDVVIILPWVLYLSSGDRDILRRQYPSMISWLSQGVQRGQDELWDPELWQLGDWLEPQAPPNEPGDCRTSGTK
jgi:alpha-L-rhamnosidase